ncbi:MAG: hypothetical protein NT175_00550 [Bacteroidetes bacterium]|nr:hypothetical protein [Bacteroidota bacterium]
MYWICKLNKNTNISGKRHSDMGVGVSVGVGVGRGMLKDGRGVRRVPPVIHDRGHLLD